MAGWIKGLALLLFGGLCVVISGAALWWGAQQDVLLEGGPAATPTALAAPIDEGRIALLREDGHIVIVKPDGSGETDLTASPGATESFRYPTWSPDGRTLAYVEFGSEDGEITSAIHLATAAGEHLRRIETEFPPFYLFWSPTSHVLAFLSNWAPDTIALRVVEREGEQRARTVTEGSPFFFSWSPGGESLLAHIGTEELAFVDLDGARTRLGIETGAFQAPHWNQEGSRLAYVVEGSEGRSVLIASDVARERALHVAENEGFFTFNWSPTAPRLAYSYTQEETGLPAFGPLWVRDVEEGGTWQLSAEPVVGYFWSPDGRYLAFLRPESTERPGRVPEAAPLRQEGGLWLRWHVWDGQRTYPVSRFQPSQPFLADYLRFFDQYAQSISVWSPDSRRLLYTGAGGDGQEGVWVVEIREGARAVRIARGSMATWSPR